MQVCSSSRRGAQLIDMDAEGRGTKGRKVKGKMGDEVFTRQVTCIEFICCFPLLLTVLDLDCLPTQS